MTWCNSFNDVRAVENNLATAAAVAAAKKQQQQQQVSQHVNLIKTCPSCGHRAQYEQAAAAATIQDLPGLPAGVKFDPTDQELLEHLEGKARPDARKLHPLIDEFIPTIEGENGICYTHPERLPGTRQGRPDPALLPPPVEGVHDGDAEAAEGAHRRAGRRDAVAQDRQDAAGVHRRQAEGVQEDPGALHQLRQAAQAGEDQLGDAPVPPGLRRGGEGRRARRVQGVLPDAAEAVRRRLGSDGQGPLRRPRRR
ncbi:Os01g0672100 [Oryza sativa Japonica Group]|uniref:Os01g0672100 protein n=2 Tax=Oryza sativa subsp. japonica TaxID=39947 RepID=C7IWQ1_ORYSJ|nr:hypothetical protein EE612_004910 [Oryza sativa]BAH91228.1 Os01g0672100 [Oryza sativa Japonica Group]BAS73616.1 Os01g0672100 [Oryza sativa Japonica Group]|eukprot:NP_001172498.1 Os01g0672100 [Oryza sativa Japonica Group]